MNKAVLITFISFFSYLNFSCTQSASNVDSDRVIVGISSPPTQLDPLMATDAVSQRITDLVFSSLISLKSDLLPHGQLALNWVQTQNRIVFNLRKDVFFHDGSPVTNLDVKKSFEKYLAPRSRFLTSLKSIKSVETQSSDQIIINLKELSPFLLYDLNTVKILKEIEGKPPVGSGPYKIKSFTNSKVELVKSDFHSHVDAIPKMIEFRVIRDENARFLQMQSGAIDFLFNDLSLDKVMLLKDKAKIEITDGLNFNYLLFNLRNSELDKNVRAAINMGIDRQDVIKNKLEDTATVAIGILTPNNPYFNKGLLPPVFDFEKAKSLLPNSKKLKFTLKTSIQGIAAARILANYIRNLGIELEIKTYEWGTFYSDVKAGRFDMAIMRWVGNISPDNLRTIYGCNEIPPGQNRGYYCNKDFDEMALKALQTPDERLRKQLYFQMQKQILDDLPVAPLWYNKDVVVYSFRIKGYKPTGTGSYENLVSVSK